MTNHLSITAALYKYSRIALVLFIPLIVWGCSKNSSEATLQKQAEAQLIESTAFRSVLDGKPRMLTLNLGNQVKIAYDTQSASIYKIWQGEIELSGAVFDSRHGPQPKSTGNLYFVAPDESISNPAFTYVGYESNSKTGETTLLYQANGNDWQAQIRESLQYKTNENGLLITQTFVVEGLPKNGAFSIKINAPWLNESSLTKGNGSIADEPSGRALVLSGNKVSFETTFTPMQQAATTDENANLHPGLALIQNSDCAACHNAQVQTVGPSYQAIAQRYLNINNAKTTLANKIISGGAGNWGQVPMSAHPDLMLQEAETMVEYIFTMAQESDSTEQVSSDLLLNQAAVDITYVKGSLSHTENRAGAYVYLSRIPMNEEPTFDSIMAALPELGGHASQIHFPNADAFTVTRDLFSLRIKTHLYLQQALKTKLRLVSDDGSYLFLKGKQIIDNWGFHGAMAVDAEVDLAAGMHPIEIVYMQALGNASLSLQWLNPATNKFELVPTEMLMATQDDVTNVVKIDPSAKRAIPGDQTEVAGVHPAFDLFQARPESFEPMVGGIDFMPDGRMVVSTWDPEGSIYLVEDFTNSPDKIKVKRIAKGLAEPLGIKVLNGDIYVLQKQELTRLVDTNGDDHIDRYELVSNSWAATANFHEFAFGLEYQNGHFYAALATAIEPGGASSQPQAPDRGKAIKINKDTGKVEFVAHGLRTPNGIGIGISNGLFIADNQGDWLPASKIVELTKGAFYGSRSVDFEGTANLPETKPVVWLPQNEIGNSPSQPAPLNIGPYKNQMIHGDVTHGGIKRVFAERVNGRLQGAVFRFSQGIEAGVNRLAWAPNGSLIVGGVGNPGNWSHSGRAWYGLQGLQYNGKSAFEMLSVSARTDGFEITFTEPVKDGQNINADNFEIVQWKYQPTAAYGGPKLNEKSLKISAFSVSEDKTKMQFKLQGLQEDRVLYFRIKQPFVSNNNNELWTSEAWYTLNAIPKNKTLAMNANYKVAHNQLSKAEQKQGWQLLFDGKSLQGLRNYNKQTLGARWVVDNGTLHLLGKKPDEDGWQSNDGGDLVLTPAPLENYELYLEWKLQKNGNSGIIYNVKERDDLAYPFLSGPEMQILDNLGHSDGQIITHRAGDNYDLIESRMVTVNPPGEWNRVRLIVNNGKVEHWLNGYKVIDTEMFTDEWNALIANSKFKDWSDFAKSPGGHIVLQDHSDKVWFRNIKILAL